VLAVSTVELPEQIVVVPEIVGVVGNAVTETTVAADAREVQPEAIVCTV